MTAIDLLRTCYTHDLDPAVASATRVSRETVICDTCGCRLTTRDAAGDPAFAGVRGWFHYAGAPGHDARGCATACVDARHVIA